MNRFEHSPSASPTNSQSIKLTPGLMHNRSKSSLSMYNSPSASIIDLKNMDYNTTIKRYRASMNVSVSVLKNRNNINNSPVKYGRGRYGANHD